MVIKKNLKWFVVAPVTFVAVLAILAGTGYYIYQKQIAKPKPVPVAQQPETQMPKAQNLETAQKSEIDTTGWQTYRNEEYRFEFKYPQGWEIKGNEIHDLKSDAYVAIAKLENPENLSFADWWEKSTIIGGRPTLLHGSGDIEINGVKAKIMYMPENKSGWHIHIADSRNNIFSLFASGKPDQENIFDEVISTFKFIAKRDDGKCVAIAKDSGLAEESVGAGFDCTYDIGTGFEKWRFASPDKKNNIEIDVYDKSNQFVQKIIIEDEAAFLSGLNLSADINYDGYKDLRVINAQGANAISFDYWIFNPKTKKFEKDVILTNIPFAKFFSADKIITGSTYSNIYGDYETVYRFIDGEWELDYQHKVEN